MIEGSCLCGDVVFELAGELTPIQLCHATRCRKATGAAYSPELLTAVDGFSWLKGKDLVKEYTAPLLRQPPAYKRAFCSRCGSPLPARIEGTGYIVLQAGILDDDPGTSPLRHTFTSQKACWHEITDGLPEFEEVPPVPEKYRS
jgi:hypothetical protein